MGVWLSLCSPAAAEIAGESGYDWACIDMEHAPNQLAEVSSQLRALEATPCQAIVRVGWNDAVEIKRVMDLGAYALMIPYVQSSAEAEWAVKYTRYPPQGVRGVSLGSRGTRYGREPRYFEAIKERVSLIVQVESRAALASIADIAAVDGIDAVFIGPADLSADMGLPGQPEHPDVDRAIDAALHAVQGRAVGLLARSPQKAAEYVSRGATFVAIGSDLGMLGQSLQQQLRIATAK